MDCSNMVNFASYPTRAFEDFTVSFDPLTINNVNQISIQVQSPVSAGALDEAGRLGKLIVSRTLPL